MVPVILKSFSYGSDEGDLDEDFDSAGETESEDEVSTNATSSSGNPPLMNVFFRCSKCPYQTKIQSLLDRHEARHALDQSFQCSVCDFSDYDHSAFVDHWVSHQPTKVVRCAFCSFRCNHSDSLKTHILTHRPVQMLDCTMCEYSSNSVKSMKSHIEKNHTTDDLEDTTPAVGKRSKSGCGTAGHHNCNCSPGSPEEPDEVVELPVCKQKIDGFNCSLCEFTTVNRLSMRYHTMVFHKKKVSCIYCPAVMTKHEVIQHVSKEHAGMMMTPDAGVDIRGQPVAKHDAALTYDGSGCPDVEGQLLPSSVRDMTARAETAKEYKCSFCDGSFGRVQHLDKHVFRLHKQKYSCGHCSTVLTKHELIQHCRNIHGVACSSTGSSVCLIKGVNQDLKDRTSEKSEELDNCDVDEAQSSSVRNVSVGSGTAANFICPFCKYSTTRYGHLDRHISSYHIKKYICNQCSAVMTRYELMEHCQILHGFTVKATDRNLKEAMLVSEDHAHTKNSVESGSAEASSTDSHCAGESGASLTRDYQFPNRVKRSAKIFKCPSCQFLSASRIGLNKHKERFHKKKYSCSHCKAVMTKYRLLVHSKKEHGVVLNAGGSMSPRDFLRHRLTRTTKCPDVRRQTGGREVPKAASPAKAFRRKISNNGGKTVKEELLQCKACEYQTARKDLLQRHEAKHLPVQCPVCGLGFGKVREFALHMTEHNPPESRYKCFYCGHVAKRMGNFSIHLSVHLEVLKKHDCPKCEFSHYRPDYLRRHVATHSKTYGAKKSERFITDSPKSIETKTNPTEISCRQLISTAGPSRSAGKLTCDSQSAAVPVSLETIKAKMSKKIEECSKKKTADGGSTNRLRTAGLASVRHKSRLGLLQCNDCSFKTAIKSVLRNHVQLHCSKRDFSGAYRSTVPRHTHTNRIKKFLCSKCPKVATKYRLAQHFKRYHAPLDSNDHRPHRVRVQEKSAAANHNSRSLTQKVIPMKNEDGDGTSENELFRCNDCDYQTARGDLMQRHEAKHVPIECPNCKMEFSNGYVFASHLSKHNAPGSRYKCVYCTYVGKGVRNLYLHLPFHLDALKKRDCSECEFSCLLPSDLRMHMATHSKTNAIRDQVEPPGKISSECLNRPCEPGLDTIQPAVDATLKCSAVSPCKLGLVPLAGPSRSVNLSRRSVTPSKSVSQSLGTPEVITEIESKYSNKFSRKKLTERNADASCFSEMSSTLVGTSSAPKAKLQCNDCSYETNIKSLMSRHTKLHLPEGQYLCPNCEFKTHKSGVFTKHLGAHAPAGDGALLQCCFCSFSTTRHRNLQKHVKVHRPVAEQFCSKCKFSCSQSQALHSHYLIHHGKKYVCPKCPKVATRFKLSQHFEKYHPSEPKFSFKLQPKFTEKPVGQGSSVSSKLKNRITAKKAFLGRIKDKSRVKMKRELLRCKSCKFQTARNTLMLLHEAEHAKTCLQPLDMPSASQSNLSKTPDNPSRTVGCSEYSQSDTGTGLVHSRGSAHKGEVFSHSPNQYQCPECDFKALREDLFQRHVSKHKPLVCPVCSSSINNNSRFAAHLAEHNPASTPFKCHYCDHIPKTLSHLSYHLAVHIKALKIYDCPLCEFSSNRPDYLRNHVSSHSSSKCRTPETSLSGGSPIIKTDPEATPKKMKGNPSQSEILSGITELAGTVQLGGVQMKVEPSVAMNCSGIPESPARSDVRMETDIEIDSDLSGNPEIDCVAEETTSVVDATEPSEEVLEAAFARPSRTGPLLYHGAYRTGPPSESPRDPESHPCMGNLMETNMEIYSDLGGNDELSAAETAPSAGESTLSEPSAEMLESPVAPMPSGSVSLTYPDVHRCSSPRCDLMGTPQSRPHVDSPIETHVENNADLWANGELSAAEVAPSAGDSTSSEPPAEMLQSLVASVPSGSVSLTYPDVGRSSSPRCDLMGIPENPQHVDCPVETDMEINSDLWANGELSAAEAAPSAGYSTSSEPVAEMLESLVAPMPSGSLPWTYPEAQSSSSPRCHLMGIPQSPQHVDSPVETHMEINSDLWANGEPNAAEVALSAGDSTLSDPSAEMLESLLASMPSGSVPLTNLDVHRSSSPQCDLMGTPQSRPQVDSPIETHVENNADLWANVELSAVEVAPSAGDSTSSEPSAEMLESLLASMPSGSVPLTNPGVHRSSSPPCDLLVTPQSRPHVDSPINTDLEINSDLCANSELSAAVAAPSAGDSTSSKPSAEVLPPMSSGNVPSAYPDVNQSSSPLLRLSSTSTACNIPDTQVSAGVSESWSDFTRRFHWS